MKNKWPNDDVWRKCKMDLQKGAAVEETSKKHRGQLTTTDKLIISAFCLRRTSFALLTDWRRWQERWQQVSSHNGSICNLSKGGSLICPYKFLFGTKNNPNKLQKTALKFPTGFYCTLYIEYMYKWDGGSTISTRDYDIWWRLIYHCVSINAASCRHK